MKLIEIEGRYIIPDLKYFLITGAEELATLPECAPGSMAYTPDLNIIAMRDEDGNWIQV